MSYLSKADADDLVSLLDLDTLHRLVTLAATGELLDMASALREAAQAALDDTATATATASPTPRATGGPLGIPRQQQHYLSITAVTLDSATGIPASSPAGGAGGAGPAAGPGAVVLAGSPSATTPQRRKRRKDQDAGNGGGPPSSSSSSPSRPIDTKRARKTLQLQPVVLQPPQPQLDEHGQPLPMDEAAIAAAAAAVVVVPVPRVRGPRAGPHPQNMQLSVSPGDYVVSCVVLRHQGNGGQNTDEHKLDQYYYQARLMHSYPQKHIWAGWESKDRLPARVLQEIIGKWASLSPVIGEGVGMPRAISVIESMPRTIIVRPPVFFFFENIKKQ